MGEKRNFLQNAIDDIEYRAAVYNREPKQRIKKDFCKVKNGKIKKCFPDIFSYLIQYTGRYTDENASEILKSMKEIKKAATNIEENRDKYVQFFIGIHRDGVESEQQIVDRFLEDKKYAKAFYRKILAVEILTPYEDDDGNYTVKAVLYDITDSIYEKGIDQMLKEEAACIR
jgi:hypothetical protein